MKWRYLQNVFGPNISLPELHQPLQGSETIGPLYSVDDRTVYQAYFYPSVDGIKKIRSRGIEFPQECCVCVEIAQHKLPIKPISRLRSLCESIGASISIRVPHCTNHANQQFASFAGGFSCIHLPHVYCYCLGFNKTFLEKLQASYSSGEFIPPWEFSPKRTPMHSWHMSGGVESWLHTAWRPFWKKLSSIEKDEYLERWDASELWREALSNENWPWNAQMGRPSEQ